VSGTSKVFAWRDALQDESGLPGLTRWVGTVLSRYGRFADLTNFRPGHGTLARRTGLDLKTVKAHLRRLESSGWIRLSDPGRPGTSASYDLLFPVGGPSAAASVPAAPQEQTRAHIERWARLVRPRKWDGGSTFTGDHLFEAAYSLITEGEIERRSDIRKALKLAAEQGWFDLETNEFLIPEEEQA
jgi:hypothetical protein